MSEASNVAVIERLDRLTQVIELAFAPQLEAARKSLREDAVDDAILLAGAGGWKAAGELRGEVEAKTKKKERTVQGRITSLTGRGVLEARGGGRTLEYRTNPVVGA